MRRIAIVGCRPPKLPNVEPEWSTWVRICAQLEAFIAWLPEGVVVVSGGAAGIDSRAATKCRARGLQVDKFFPDYDVDGERAPLVRNQLIA